VRLAGLAGRQHGVVSLVQLSALGFTKDSIARRLTAGRLHRLHRGTYAVGHVALTSKAHDMAAVISCGPEAVLSHRSAAVRWGFLRHAPLFEVTVAGRRIRRAGMTVRGSASLPPEDRAVVDAIPVTSPARTLVDLAEVLTERRLADAVHEAEVQRVLDVRAVERALARVPGRPGRHRLRRVLAAYDGGPPMTRSEAERRFLRLCELHSVPRPQANVLVGTYEVDFHWPGAKLVVEVDGRAVHHTRKAFHADRRRDRALAAEGIQVLRVTWSDLDDEAGLARELLRVLRGRPQAARTYDSQVATAASTDSQVRLSGVSVGQW
jgi:very-short-patch-repair endonuclease